MPQWAEKKNCLETTDVYLRLPTIYLQLNERFAFSKQLCKNINLQTFYAKFITFYMQKGNPVYAEKNVRSVKKTIPPNEKQF